jgi:hypothetical protein
MILASLQVGLFFIEKERVIENEKAFPESSLLIWPKIFCKLLLRNKKNREKLK